MKITLHRRLKQNDQEFIDMNKQTLQSHQHLKVIINDVYHGGKI